jgi:hypothetical protein
MSDAIDWTKRIECVINRLTRFCESRPDLVSTFFLTGSYARGQHSSNSPNVNLYFISVADRSFDLRVALAAEWDELRKWLWVDRLDLLIDCHPYTLSSRRSEAMDSPRLTITSKVLDAKHQANRYSLPPTIGLGWLRAYKILWGDTEALQCLAMRPRPDVDWFHALHEALTRYRNLLDHLPWAIPWLEYPNWFAEESFRYAEEAIRDGIPVALTSQELSDGFQFDLYHDWRREAPAFFKSRYGQLGEWAVERIGQMKSRVAQHDTWGCDEARAIWDDALKIWEMVWAKFCVRVHDECPAHDRWLTRVNSFV